MFKIVVMYILLVIIVVIVALLLIGIVLIQESKGSSFTSRFDEYKRKFGIKESMSIIEKATWILAGIIIVSCVIIAYIVQ